MAVVHRFHGLFVALFTLLLSLQAHGQGLSPSAPPDLAKADQLLRAGQADDAYQLLAPHEFNQAGNEDFDYILGVAALESNRADQATLIFERVLAVNPNHAAARLDMGRAYFALGDLERARTEFASARQFGPPPAALATIDRYLATIDARASVRAFTITSYLEATAGYDSNVNTTTGKDSIFAPLFGVDLTLAGNSVSRSDEFLALGGGVDMSYALTDRFSVLAGADIRQRGNYTADTFDFRNSDYRVGGQYSTGADALRLTLGRNDYELDNVSYRRTQNVTAEWRRTLDAATQLSLFAQDARSRYWQSAARSNSSNLFMYGASGVRKLDEASRTYAFVSVFRGADVATDSRSDGDRRLYGGRVGMQSALRPDADWYTSIALQKSTYSVQNAIFRALRKDFQYDFNAGVNWQLSRDWLLRPQVSFSRNDSNVSLNDYEKTEMSVTLRRDFR